MSLKNKLQQRKARQSHYQAKAQIMSRHLAAGRSKHGKSFPDGTPGRTDKKPSDTMRDAGRPWA